MQQTVPTLLEFASDEMLIDLLIRERAKYRRRNRSDKHHRLDKQCELSELSVRKMLSRMMPPRRYWVHPKKKIRDRLANETNSATKLTRKALQLTIERDKERAKKGVSFDYLNELTGFIERIQSRLQSGNITFSSPQLVPVFKDKKPQGNHYDVTCRPLSVYTALEDKIILALISKYLTRHFDRFLHTNILSYRKIRSFHGKQRVTDFNDGIELIRAFREAHKDEPIYAADCDIKKFYDIIPHRVVLDCFGKLLNHVTFTHPDGRDQVMHVLEAYLASYNFYDNAWLAQSAHPEVFDKVRRRLHDRGKRNTYRFGWVDECLKEPEDAQRCRGISQGGALSLLIANIVLNDVDSVLTAEDDPNRLFVRFCDDMILLHTDYDRCCRLMQHYARSLEEHGLYYHDFRSVDASDRKAFWHIKSHYPFLWDDDQENSNRYIGFLGYEMRRDGRIRLRKSNIQRVEDKFLRQFYALRRYRQQHTDEEYQAQKQKALTRVLDSVEVYKGLDQAKFRSGSQYRHLVKILHHTEHRLLRQPRK